MIRKLRKKLFGNDTFYDAIGEWFADLEEVTCEGFVVTIGIITCIALLILSILFLILCFKHPIIFLPILFTMIFLFFGMIFDSVKEMREERERRYEDS